jgi:hypothetical protein
MQQFTRGESSQPSTAFISPVAAKISACGPRFGCLEEMGQKDV